MNHCTKPLADNYRRDLGIALKELGDVVFEGIESARSLAYRSLRVGLLQVLGYGVS
jgi:hypothetical protein